MTKLKKLSYHFNSKSMLDNTKQEIFLLLDGKYHAYVKKKTDNFQVYG